MTDYIEFSAKIKEKYPQYKDVDDLVLAQKMVEKYPEYKEQVTFEGVNKDSLAEPQNDKKGIDLTPSGLVKGGLASVLAPIRGAMYGEDYKTARKNALANAEKIKPVGGAGDFLIDMLGYSQLPVLRGSGALNFVGNAAIQGGVPAAIESLKRGGNALEGAGVGTGIAGTLQTIPKIGGLLSKGADKGIELSGRLGQIKPETLKQVIKPDSKALEMTSEDASNALLDVTKQIRENFDTLRNARGQAVDDAIAKLGDKTKRFELKDLLGDIKGTFDQYQKDLVNPARQLAGGLEDELTRVVKTGTENPSKYYEYVPETKSPYYSKEKEQEAFNILSEATGKPVNWLKSQLNANTFENGVGKRKEFIENLIGKTDDKLEILGNEYFDGNKFYKPSDLSEVGAGQEIAQKAFDDIVNKRFNVYTDDPLNRAINQADSGYKELLSKIAQNPRNEEVYNQAYPELQKIIDGLPEELQAQYTNEFFTALDDIYNKANTVSPLSLQGIKETIGKMSKWGDETAKGYAEPITKQIYGKYMDRLSELSPEVSAANKAFSDLMNYKKNDTTSQILKGKLLEDGKLGGAPRALKSYKSSIDKAQGAKNLQDLENLLVNETDQQPFLNQVDDINAAMDLLKTETTGIGGVASIAKALLTRPVLAMARGANRIELPQKLNSINEALKPIGKLMPALGGKAAANMLYGGVEYNDYR